MKKWLLGMMAAVMAVSLAACTPTTEAEGGDNHSICRKSGTGSRSDYWRGFRQGSRSKCRTCSCYFYLPQRRRRQPGSGDGFS